MTDADIAKAAIAMAEYSGWDGWHTATTCQQTLSGNTPDEEREHFMALARIAAEAFGFKANAAVSGRRPSE